MADVFISYARSTEPQAQQIAKALRALGYGVWRDDDLPAHRDYTTVIEERLHVAKAVVVAWSAEAVKSRWVCAEADVAHEAGILVQLTLDGSTPPMPFNRIQCADMSGWTGEADAPGWRKVLASVVELVGAEAETAAPAEPAPPAPARPLTGAAARWAAIESSLDPEDYADFLQVFPQSEEAFEARRQKRRLEAWTALDKTDPAAVSAFLRTGSFAALQTVAQAVADDLAAAKARSQPPAPPTPASVPAPAMPEPSSAEVAPPPAAPPPRAAREASTKPAARVAIAEPAPVQPQPTESPPVRRPAPWLFVGAAAAVVAALGVGGALFLTQPHPKTVVVTVTKSRPGPGLGPAPAASVQEVAQDADGLVADAKNLGRPAQEISALSSASSSIAALTAQIDGLPPSSPASARTALVAQLNTLAANMAGAEATALNRAAESQLREAGRTLAGAAAQNPGAGQSLTAERQAGTTLSNAAAAVSQATDADASIEAARQTLLAYGAFADANAATTRFYGPARKAELAEATAQAHALASQVISLAGGSRPWLFATQSRKQAYQELQTNAATAREQIGQLDQLSQSVGSGGDAAQLERALAEASSVKQSLARLYADSSAAAEAAHGGSKGN